MPKLVVVVRSVLEHYNTDEKIILSVVDGQLPQHRTHTPGEMDYDEYIVFMAEKVDMWRIIDDGDEGSAGFMHEIFGCGLGC